MPLKYHFRKNTIFSENLKNLIFQKIRFFYIFGKTWYFGFFHFLQKRCFFVFLLFLSFSSFSKKWGNVGILCFLVFSQNVHFYKISFFYTIVKKGGFRNMWDLIKIDVFSMCVFRYGMPRCDMGTPRWNRYRELESILWSWYCTHTLWGGNFWWLWRRCGDVEMGMSMCGRFGDWVILVTELSCGLGYPVTELSWGWYNQSDWEDWVVRRVEEVGDGDNLGYTCNLLEHEWTWIFPHVLCWWCYEIYLQTFDVSYWKWSR